MNAYGLSKLIDLTPLEKAMLEVVNKHISEVCSNSGYELCIDSVNFLIADDEFFTLKAEYKSTPLHEHSTLTEKTEKIDIFRDENDNLVYFNVNGELIDSYEIKELSD